MPLLIEALGGSQKIYFDPVDPGESLFEVLPDLKRDIHDKLYLVKHHLYCHHDNAYSTIHSYPSAQNETNLDYIEGLKIPPKMELVKKLLPDQKFYLLLHDNFSFSVLTLKLTQI